MCEDLEANIAKWQRDLYATREQDLDGGPPLSGFDPVPDTIKRDLARTNLRFVIENRPGYAGIAQRAFEEGLAQREIVDRRIEGTGFRMGCVVAYYGILIGGAAAIWGAIELVKYLSS